MLLYIVKIPVSLHLQFKCKLKFHRLLAIKRLMRSVTAEGRSAALCENNLHKHDLLTANLTLFPSFCRNTRSSRCMKPNM